MKHLFIFLLFCISVFANTIAIDQPLEDKIYTKETLLFIDKDSQYTLENIQSIKDKFTPTDKPNADYQKSPVWIYFKLINNSGTDQTFILKNGHANMLYIDVLAIKGESYEKHYLGCLREKEMKKIPNRYSLFQVNLKKNESAEIYIKHLSDNTVNLKWEISNFKTFINDTFYQTILFGFFAGAVFTLIVYTLSLYKTFKEKNLLYYTLFAFGNLVLFFSITGTLYMLDLGFSPHMSISFSNVFNFFPILMLSLFILDFFQVKKFSKKITTILYVIMFISIAIMLLNVKMVFGFERGVPAAITNTTLLICYFIFFILSIIFVKHKFTGSKYFLLSTNMMLIVFTLGVLYVKGYDILIVDPIYYIIFSVVADLLFISLAIAQKIDLIRAEKEKTEKIMLEHTRYKNIGTMIADVTHQFKTPISQLSALANRISMIFDKTPQNFTPEEHKVALDLEKNIMFMGETINSLYNSYRSDSRKTRINIDLTMQQILDLFSSQINKYNIKINQPSSNLILFLDASSLKHILLTIVENSIDIIKEREVQYPYISINSFMKEKNLYIEIVDNAGGVNTQEINDIFGIYYSNKKKKGLGLGLALAKSLIIDTLKGDIKVKNTQDGVLFTLIIPI